MIRLFLPPEKLTSDQIIVSGEQARYLSLVLRVKPGETLTIFDGLGYRYTCRITSIHKKEVIVEKIKKEQYSAESTISITLAQGIPKGEKMDFIVQKSTELGVKKIIPLTTERSQIKHTEKAERWRKIALSASQQCGREKVPEIGEIVEFEKFVERVACYLTDESADSVIPVKTGIQTPSMQKQGTIPKILDSCSSLTTCGNKLRRNDNIRGIIFSEEQKERNLKKILSSFKDARIITLLIGPEGGFTPEEIKLAVEEGFLEASLGPRTLRAETAAVTAISIIQYEFGDMG